MLRLIRYDESLQPDWDKFLDSAINSHFFFGRSFFLHQKEKFQDHSLMVYDRDALVALLPGVEMIDESGDKSWHTHAGLSFGGVILSPKTGMVNVLDLFTDLKRYLLRNDFKTAYYKAMPYIYYSIPCQEDRYALFTLGAKLVSTQPYSVISPGNYSGLNSRQRTRLRSLQCNFDLQIVSITGDGDLLDFHNGLSQNLMSRHGVKPVHSFAHLNQLIKIFPENIIAKGLMLNGKLFAGTLLFISKHVIHTQYLYNTPNGQKKDSLMYLIDALIKEYHHTGQYFSFGISTEQMGKVLNTGLIGFKEKFGARAVAQDFYNWPLKENVT